MHILLVEDEDPKRRHIEEFLRSEVPTLELFVAKSVRSALDRLDEKIPDLVILDMSLPTFDIGGDEGGGRPQGFGGVELIRNMELEEICCPAIVLTGYESFSKAGGQVGLDALSRELMDAHPAIFRGIFHFNSAYGDWRIRVAAILKSMEKDK